MPRAKGLSCSSTDLQKQTVREPRRARNGADASRKQPLPESDDDGRGLRAGSDEGDDEEEDEERDQGVARAVALP